MLQVGLMANIQLNRKAWSLVEFVIIGQAAAVIGKTTLKFEIVVTISFTT